MSLGETIKRIRLQRGLTQAELGFLIGADDAMIRKYESNKQLPKIDKLEKLSHALGVNVEVFLSSDLNEIQAIHKLFQLFRQYKGSFIKDGNLGIYFSKMDLRPWYNRWLIYQEELAAANAIQDEQARQYALEDAEDKFNWWMDTYPKSDEFNKDFDKELENYRKLKNKRRKKGNS